METYKEIEIRRAAKLLGISDKLVTLLFLNISELRNEENVKFIYFQALDMFSSDKGWEEKYDFIFSEQISKKVNHLFDYYDPDTSYEADVKAFMRAFTEYVTAR